MNHNEYKLVQEIVALSVADDWRSARDEWELVSVFFADHCPGTCLCGHYPIIQHCVLVNRLNGNEAVVGNVCVTRFMEIEVGSIFTGLARIMADRTAALNKATVEHAHRRGWINDWERSYYLDTMRKRKLSQRQRAKRAEINDRVLEWVRQWPPRRG